MKPRARKTLIAGGSALVLAAAAATALTLTGNTGSPKPAAAKHGAAKHQAAPARLIDSSCGGPAGAAYVAVAGWSGFTAVNTANCKVIQTYNVDDPQVPGYPGSYNYSSTDEGIAIHGSTLYFADTGSDTVSVVDASKLDPKNYNPAETDIHVGFNPAGLAVTPDGRQLWVADTGPQTSAASPADVKVIDTATDKVTATLKVGGAPSAVAFSPSGTSAYVLTPGGLSVYSTTTLKRTRFIGGLREAHGLAVAPRGTAVYVTDTSDDTVRVIDAAAGRIVRSVKVGDLPWQVAVSADGGTVYAANPDSDTVSVIDAATAKVTRTIAISGDPDSLALTPDGSQLWVGSETSAYLTVVKTADDSVIGSINLGGSEPQSGDGFEPTGLVLTSTPTPGS